MNAKGPRWPATRDHQQQSKVLFVPKIHVYTNATLNHCLINFNHQQAIHFLSFSIKIYFCVTLRLVTADSCLQKKSKLRNAKHIQNLIFPIGKDCLRVMHESHQTHYSLNHKLFQENVEEISFEFHTHSSLGVNITFKTFHLSSQCLGFSWKMLSRSRHNRRSPVCEADGSSTEFVWLCLNKRKDRTCNLLMDAIVFCMKRPQWSVFSQQASNTILTYQFCKKCLRTMSTLVFRYQVIESGTFETHNDNLQKEFFGGQFSIVMRRETITGVPGKETKGSVSQQSTSSLVLYSHTALVVLLLAMLGSWL